MTTVVDPVATSAPTALGEPVKLGQILAKRAAVVLAHFHGPAPATAHEAINGGLKHLAAPRSASEDHQLS